MTEYSRVGVGLLPNQGIASCLQIHRNKES